MGEAGVWLGEVVEGLMPTEEEMEIALLEHEEEMRRESKGRDRFVMERRVAERVGRLMVGKGGDGVGGGGREEVRSEKTTGAFYRFEHILPEVKVKEEYRR